MRLEDKSWGMAPPICLRARCHGMGVGGTPFWEEPGKIYLQLLGPYSLSPPLNSATENR